jgi:RNA polymerase sigma-70 factor (ECF subfamily)
VAQGSFQRKRHLEEEGAPGEVSRAVARAKQGDEAAVRFLYLRYADNIFGYVRSIVRNEYDAEDITQQVFTRMLTAIGGYEQRSTPFSAWLLRIAHNMSIDHLRRRRPAPLEEDPPLAETRAASAASEIRDDLCSALSELPELQRKVLMLRHLGGYSPGEIAVHLGRSEDSIHGLHHRARRELKQKLVSSGTSPVTVAA